MCTTLHFYHALAVPTQRCCYEIAGNNSELPGLHMITTAIKLRTTAHHASMSHAGDCFIMPIVKEHDSNIDL